MAMGLEPKWTDLSDMLATCTDDQLLKWKDVAENPRGDNFEFITSLRQLVVHMYNKRAKDIINELYTAVNNELNSRKSDVDMDKKLEARIARSEKLISGKRVKNEGSGRETALRVSELGGTLLSYMMDLDTYAKGEISSKLNEAYAALTDLVNFIDNQVV